MSKQKDTIETSIVNDIENDLSLDDTPLDWLDEDMEIPLENIENPYVKVYP